MRGHREQDQTLLQDPPFPDSPSHDSRLPTEQNGRARQQDVAVTCGAPAVNRVNLPTRLLRQLRPLQRQQCHRHAHTTASTMPHVNATRCYDPMRLPSFSRTRLNSTRVNNKHWQQQQQPVLHPHRGEFLLLSLRQARSRPLPGLPRILHP